MKRTKLTALLLTFAMVLSLALAGCNSNGTTSTPADSNPRSIFHHHLLHRCRQLRRHCRHDPGSRTAAGGPEGHL